MLVDLKAHYLDLLVAAMEVGGNACLHREDSWGLEKGLIYVTASPKNTAAVMVVQYNFDDHGYQLQVEFKDERPKFQFGATFVEGLEPLWPKLLKAMSGNRLTDKIKPAAA